MTKSSHRRRTRGDRARSLGAAKRFLDAGDYARAIEPLSEAVRLAPNDARLLNNLGLACMFARRLPEAVMYLRRSIAADPSAGATHHNLGLALQDMGDDEAAIATYRDAVALSPDEAEEELRQVIASDPSAARAHLILGRVLKDVGRFDEAAACFERSLALEPWQSLAHQELVTTRRMTEVERPWLTRILLQLESKEWTRTLGPAVVDQHRMALHFAAGKAFDDLGGYGDAMTHFHAANRIRHQIWPFLRDGVERLVDRIVARFTRASFADRSAIRHDDSAPIFILGMPRSGTTLLEQIVSSHPQVRGRGELDFWNERGLEWTSAEPDLLASAADQLRSDYQAVLRAPPPLRATDKMPFNFFWIGLVHLLFPNARFVHSRRDPIDTCLSIYKTPLRATWGFASALDDLVWYYRLYVRLMDHWRAVIPADRLLDIDYEDVVAKPEESSRRLVAFCGLEWDPACLRPEEHLGAVKTASNWQVRQPIYRSSVERWRRYEPWIGELLELRQRGGGN